MNDKEASPGMLGQLMIVFDVMEDNNQLFLMILQCRRGVRLEYKV
jgi:hypothetical protein